MTRRELELTVIEAASEYARMAWDGAIFNTIRALDACTEPDLVALNEKVAEAADKCDWSLVQWPDLNPFIGAVRARRKAMKPKVRYAADGFTVYDHERSTHVTMTEVVALLNAQEKS